MSVPLNAAPTVAVNSNALSTLCGTAGAPSGSSVELMNSNLSVSKYIDQAIALQTIKLVEHVFQQRQWGLAMLGTFMFVASIDGAKKIVNKLVDKSVDGICNMKAEEFTSMSNSAYRMMWYPALQVYSGMKRASCLISSVVGTASSSSNNTTKHKFIPQSSRKYSATLSENLWVKLAQHPYFSKVIQVSNIEHLQDGKLIQHEQWSELRLVTPEFTVIFSNELHLAFHITATFKKLISVTTSSSSSTSSFNYEYDPEIDKVPLMSFAQYAELRGKNFNVHTHRITNGAIDISVVRLDKSNTSSTNNFYSSPDLYVHIKNGTITHSTSSGRSNKCILRPYQRNLHKIVGPGWAFPAFCMELLIYLYLCLFNRKYSDTTFVQPTPSLLAFSTFEIHCHYYEDSAGVRNSRTMLRSIFGHQGFTRALHKLHLAVFFDFNAFAYCYNQPYRYEDVEYFISQLLIILISIGVDYQVYRKFVDICIHEGQSFYWFDNNTSYSGTPQLVNYVCSLEEEEKAFYEVQTYLQTATSVLDQTHLLQARKYFLQYFRVITKPATPCITPCTTSSASSTSATSGTLVTASSSFSIIHNKLDLTPEQQFQTFVQFLDKLQTSTSSGSSGNTGGSSGSSTEMKIKVNYIKISNVTEEKEVPNPEYASYMKRVNAIVALGTVDKDQKEKDDEKEKKDTKDTKNTKVQDSALTMHILDKCPPEHLIKIVQSSKVLVNHLNDVYKSMDTLYLRAEDKRQLVVALDNFRNKKELMQELGFPLKLGVLLYGAPGTGKSATILAIASYLQKDLFYVDLKTIKTNADLRRIIDHIVTINLNGGVIVFEDIDANSSIVHSRLSLVEQSTSPPVTEATTSELCQSEEGELTLDYILNVLQGTLTRDNTVFVITTNHIEKLDPALIREGRIDVKIDMKLCNNEQVQQMWQTIFKRNLRTDLSSRFMNDQFTPAQVITRCAQYLSADIDQLGIDEVVLSPFL